MTLALLLSAAGCTQPYDAQIEPDFSSPLEIYIFPRHDSGWFFTVFPDGRVNAQCGSDADDEAWVPPGSIDFQRLLDEIDREKTSRVVRSNIQAGVRYANAQTIQSDYLKNDQQVMAMLRRLDGQWQQWEYRLADINEPSLKTASTAPKPGNDLETLLEQCPMWPREETASSMPLSDD